MKFKNLERVAVYGCDETTQWFGTGQKNPYRLTGRVVRICANNTYKVEIDNSGSQDTEGYPAIVLYHEKQMRKLKHRITRMGE